MEKEGLRRCIKVLEEHFVNIVTLVTDRHPKIIHFIQKEFGNIQHYFDVWHVAKCKFVTSLIHIIFKIQQFTISRVNICLIKQSTGINRLCLQSCQKCVIFICCCNLIEWTVAIIHNINITYYTWFKLIVSKVKTTFPIFLLSLYLYVILA